MDMNTFLVVGGGLLTFITGWLTWMLRDHQQRINIMERQAISYDQMEKYVTLRQEPLYVLLKGMAEDMHQLRKLMERRYESQDRRPD